ncbi:MAG TPA: excinuclease ABC subunit UvrC [Thermoleophilaceae bacterium]|nr:excinuclease ABC subunit UvrC [Actinomycetota bacterium]HYN49913.1 excinuclease ABC subunit UvrC [Thermoleophilaceae bacterium]
MAATDTQSTEERLKEQRRELPDAPGVYLFRDERRKVLYVGKALSIRKRVAGHFSRPRAEMIGHVQDIDFIATETEAEALLAEQEFIKRHRPVYNVRLRDDKSYPYIGISLDEEYPRIYFTRERHRRNRVYFGPFSNAKRVRETLDLLGKVFQYRTCDGSEPGRASGSPCLDYFIKRCQAPCVGYISKEAYRENVDTIIDFLSGRYRQIERALDQGMQKAAAEQEFERAAMLRNRLKAVRSLLERQRIANEAVGTLDAIGVAAEETDANAQVFQVRDGVLQDRQSFYLENAAQRDEGEVAEEFVLQYYASAIAVPPQVIVPRTVTTTDTLALALSERRGAPVEVRHAERGDKRRILDLAERNARLALDQDRLRSERRRSQRIEALDGLQRALGMEVIPMRVECFDISNLMGSHTVASMVVFEGGAPKKSDYRRFGIRRSVQDDFAAMAEVLSRRMAQYVAQRERSPHDKDYDESFASLPALIVIDGGRGQLSAGLKELGPFRDLGVTVISLAKRIEEVFEPGSSRPLRLSHDTPELQLLQRARDEAHRFAIDFHRGRRDRAMTRSILDELPGVGPTRKRNILQHFGSPERFLEASSEELEAVPGLPGKVARDIHAYVNKVR